MASCSVTNAALETPSQCQFNWDCVPRPHAGNCVHLDNCNVTVSSNAAPVGPTEVCTEHLRLLRWLPLPGPCAAHPECAPILRKGASSAFSRVTRRSPRPCAAGRSRRTRRRKSCDASSQHSCRLCSSACSHRSCSPTSRSMGYKTIVVQTPVPLRRLRSVSPFELCDHVSSVDLDPHWAHQRRQGLPL